VLHLAAPDELDSAADPEAAFVANAVYTRRLVEAAAAAGVRRFIRVSTAHVYGRLDGTIDEDTCPRPTHPYGIAHRAAEDWVLAEGTGRRMSRIVVRLSNGFGAPVQPATTRWKLLVNDLCRQAVETGVLTMRSDGGAWRNFLPLGDIERLAVHLLGLDDATVGAGVFNAGSAQSMRVMDMADRVAGRCERLLHRRPPVVAPPPAGHEYPRLDYRIDRLLGTGFRPLGDVDAEIDRLLRACLDWFGAGVGRER
jgi:UDP-glucose 4-epimerase